MSLFGDDKKYYTVYIYIYVTWGINGLFYGRFSFFVDLQLVDEPAIIGIYIYIHMYVYTYIYT